MLSRAAIALIVIVLCFRSEIFFFLYIHFSYVFHQNYFAYCFNNVSCEFTCFDCAFVTDDESAPFLPNGDVAMEDSDCDGAAGRSAVDGCGGSPSAQRKKRLCKLRDSLKCRDMVESERLTPDGDGYSDSLPEVVSHNYLENCVCS